MPMRYLTPLRYPGGKQKLGKFFSQVLIKNRLIGGHYVEPFAGGAGVAMHLLHHGFIKTIHLNDIDRSLYAFWYSVTRRNSKLCEMIKKIPITVKEWDRQKDIQRNKRSANLLELGFSTLFLNRCNRSGILRAGMIGGRHQDGKWRLDARFNKESLIERIMALKPFVGHISISCMDARQLLKELANCIPKRTFFYLDPPYIVKSKDLYINHYREEDHALLASTVKTDLSRPWIMTYDNTLSVRKLYRSYQKRIFHISYTADNFRDGQEVMIFSNGLKAPQID